MIRVDSNAVEVERVLKNVSLSVRLNPEDMKEIGEKVSEYIVDRTYKRSQDIYGNYFKDYSREPAYISGRYYPYAKSAGGRITYVERTGPGVGLASGGYGRRKIYNVSSSKKKKRTRSGIMRSVYFRGGYRQFKSGLGTSSPDLKVEGRLLGLNGYARPFGPIDVGANYVVIDFYKTEEQRKAEELHLIGYEFWGFISYNESEADILAGWIQEIYNQRSDSEDIPRAA